jgi:hypothetical protein
LNAGQNSLLHLNIKKRLMKRALLEKYPSECEEGLDQLC